MKLTDEEFLRLVDIIHSTPQPRINRQDAMFIAERLVEAGVIKEEALSPLEDTSPLPEAVKDQVNTFWNVTVKNEWLELPIGTVVNFGGADYEKITIDKWRAQKPFKQDLFAFHEVGLQVSDVTIVSKTKTYAEIQEARKEERRQAAWAEFNETFIPEIQRAILDAGPSNPDHPEHEHTDCCK